MLEVGNLLSAQSLFNMDGFLIETMFYRKFSILRMDKGINISVGSGDWNGMAPERGQVYNLHGLESTLRCRPWE